MGKEKKRDFHRTRSIIGYCLEELYDTFYASSSLFPKKTPTSEWHIYNRKIAMTKPGEEFTFLIILLSLASRALFVAYTSFSPHCLFCCFFRFPKSDAPKP